ncbi:MAG: choice-of-anchor D domain-containing protein [Candidatus Cloacimonadales bacterium]
MKKIILAFMLCVLMITSVFAGSADIGDGTSTSYLMPADGYYNNNWSHFILPGDAITSVIDITKLEFDVSNTPPSYVMNNQTVYMKLTTATTVGTAYTATPATAGYTQVYSGSVTWNGSGWQGIALASPFVYDGTSNLEIIWENRAGNNAGWGNYALFNTTSATTAGAYSHSDSGFPEESGYNYQLDYYPNTRVTWAEEGEPIAPILVSPANNAINVDLNVHLNWTTGANTDHAVLYIADNLAWTGATVVDPATTNYIASVASGTTYFWKVVAVGPTNIEATSVVNSFTTEFLPITQFPYTEGFEGTWVGSPAAPLGWSQITVSGIKPWETTTTNHSGSKSAMGPWASAGGEHLLITPTFDLDAGTDYRLKFWLKGGATWDETSLTVQIASDYTDATSFTEELAYFVGDDNMPANWTEQTVSLVGFSGNQAIAFRLIDDNGLSCYIDDVTIEEVPTTPIVQIDTDPIEFGTVDLNAVPHTENVSIKNIGGGILTITNIAIIGTDASQFSLADIVSNTLTAEEELLIEVTFNPTTAGAKTATLQITDDFAASPYEISLTGTGVDTDITAGDMPYYVGFENEADMLGWTSNIGSTNTSVTADRYSGTAHTGTYSYKVYNSSDTSATAELISPVVVPDMDAYRIRFWAKKNSTSNTQPLVVGKYNQAMDSFTPYSSLALTASYAEYRVNMNTPLRANERIAFQFSFSGTYQYFYIDDLVFEEAPTGTLIQITPDVKDFGNVMLGYEASQTFTISNNGVIAATINAVDVPTGYATTFAGEAVTLEPNTSIAVDVTFTPVTEMIYSGNLRVKEADGAFTTVNHDVALTGTGVPVPQGASCSNPIPLTFPANFTGTTEGFIDDYESSWVTPSSNYLGGDDIVYQFTLANGALLNGSITPAIIGDDIGALILQEEPNATTPAAIVLSKTSMSAALDYTNEFIPAGTYFLIISSWPSPQSFEYTINLTAEPIPAPAAATYPAPANEAVDQPSIVNLSWNNANYTETIDLWFGEAGARDMTKVLDNVAAVEEWTTPQLATNATYNWKVVNRNYTGETVPEDIITWSFSTIGSAPEAVTYTAPANEAIDRPIVGDLTWSSATGAEGYRVYLSTDNTFIGVNPVEQPGTSYAYSGLEYSTTYYWKVLPYNVVGAPTEGILTWSFTTVPSPFPNADLIFDGVRSVNQGMPMEPYYGYTMTQNIYQQAELNLEGSAITSISYLYNKNMAYSETVEIYMGHTTKNTFADGYDWQLAGFSHVFSGTMSVTTSEAVVTFTLDTPFAYNNTDNLVVAFFATQSGYQSNSAEFFNYPVVGNRSLTVYSDGTNYHTTFPSSVPSGTLKAFRPVSGFNYTALSADPEFTVSAETLTFADEEMGMVSSAQTLTISNLGLAPLGINSIVLAGTNANQFQVIDNNTYPATLATAGNMTVQVKYAPTTEGDHTATLEITDNQLRVVHTVQLLGSSIDNNVYATALPWSESFEGALSSWWTIMQATTTSATISINSAVANVQNGAKAIQFTNSSDTAANLQLISPTIVPDMDTYRLRFWMKGTAGSQMLLAKYDPQITTLTEVATFTVPLTYEQTIVEFTETTSGNERFVFKPLYSATYQYVYLDNVTFEAIPVLPLAELSVTTLDFGDVPLLETSEIATVSITNVGPGVLTITDVAITGTDAGLFAWAYTSVPPVMALATDESLDINVTFTPDTQGAKAATLVITDDLGRAFRVNSATKATNNNRAANNVALVGNGWVPPQGSTCADPLPLVFPAVNVAGYTGDYGDDYDNAWVTPSSYYLSGDDVVYQFTLAQGKLLNGTIITTGSWIGAFILEEEPNVTTPAPIILQKTTSGQTLTYTNEFIPAGTYFLIISSYTAPQSIDYTINLTADPIPAPAAATNPTPGIAALNQPTALTLSWTNANYTETVDLWLGLPGGMTKVLNNVAVVNQYQATGLLTNTVYNWKVVNRNYTGETVDTLVTTWSFTTVGNAPAAVTYTAPANAATNVALNGNLSWGAATGAQGYRVYLSTDNTFAGVTPVEQTTRTYAYSGLDYSTTYYWKVLPYNVVGVPTEGVLVWSFTTIADPTVPMPISLNFEGTTTVPAVITLKNMSVAANVHGNIGNVLYKNVWSATSGAYAQFQSMNNITAGSVISFDYRVVGYNSPYAAWTLVAGYDYFVAKVSTDNGATFTTIDQINSTNHTNSNVMASRTIDISEYAGLSVIFRFEMNWPLVGDYYFDLDNIFFGVPPTAPIAALSATELNFGAININETSPKVVTIQNIGVGTLNITSIGIVGANAAEYSYTTVAGASMALANGQSLPITVVFAPISAGLKEATLQITDDLGRTFRVNTNSKNSNGNRNVNAVALTGNCIDPTIVSFPFTEGFEVGNTHASTNVSMWSQISVLGGGLWNINKTFTTYNRTPRTGEYNVTLQYSNTDWLIRPAQLVGGQAYDIELYARQDVTAGATIGIYYGTAANAASMTSITGQVAVINGDYQLVAGTFTPATSGIYYIGIKADLTSNPWHISVDDISIRESATELDIPTNVVLMTTGNGSTLTWDAVTSANSYIVYGCATPDGDYVELGRTATPYYVSYIEDGEMMKFFRVTASTEPAGTPAKGNRRN